MKTLKCIKMHCRSTVAAGINMTCERALNPQTAPLREADVAVDEKLQIPHATVSV